MTGPVILITGSGSGLGAALAEGLASDGCRISLIGRTLARCEAVAERIRGNGGEALAIGAEVADAAAVERAVAGTLERFGRLDVLINNAGVHAGKRLLETTDADWEAVVGASLTGAFHCTRAAFRVMREQGRGHIITIASQAAGYAGPWEFAYGVAKAGQVRMTLHVLAEMEAVDAERQKAGLPPAAFAAHVLCPGAIDTPLRDAFGESPAARARMLSTQDLLAVVRTLLSEPTLGRSALAEHFAGRFQVGPIGIFAAHEAIIRIWQT